MGRGSAGGDALRPVASAVFWGSASLLAYVYLGYPALVRAWSGLRPKPILRAPAEPEVTMLVVAHNEADNVAERLENALVQAYPADKLEIVLASDGSTDETVERARVYEPAGVTVMAFERRRGKPAVLNDLVPSARGEIVVLGDARQRFAPDAVRALVAPFADARVGAVSGELILREDGADSAVGQGVGFYWRYEKFMRAHEGRIDSTVGVTGAVYAIRRHLFEAIPDDTILDDVLIPLRIVRRGYRVVFEPAARAFDRPAADAGQEFARKARTLAGNFQLFSREPWLLSPRRNRVWVQTLSHKGLRLIAPLLHAGAFLAALPLTRGRVYRLALAAQLAFYAAAAAGGAGRNARRRPALLSVPYAMCLLNGATVAGFVRFLRGRQPATWARS